MTDTQVPWAGAVLNPTTGGYMTPENYERWQQTQNGGRGCGGGMAIGCSTQPQMTSQQFLQANPNPTPEQIASFDQSRGVISSTYVSPSTGQVNLLNPIERMMATNPGGQVLSIGGNLIFANAGAVADYAKGNISGMLDVLAGAGISRFSGGNTPTQPVRVEGLPAPFISQSRSAAEANAASGSMRSAVDFISNLPLPFISQSRPAQPALNTYNPIDTASRTVKNLYVPEGSYQQQQFQNVKVGMSQSGELGIYENLGKNESGTQRMAVNPDTGKLEPYVLIGGGGRAAAQSGMFGFEAGTPAVYGRGEVQKGLAGLITPAVMAPGLENSRLTGEEVYRIVAGGNNKQYDINDYLSKLGSEAYGGTVQLNDKRTLGNITYEDVSNRAPWNLARYVDPMAVNMGKAELPGANIPWSVSESTSPLFFMDYRTKSGEGAPAITIPSEIAGYFPKLGSAFEKGDVTGKSIIIPQSKVSSVSSEVAQPIQPNVEMARAPDGKLYPVEFMGGQSGWKVVNATEGRLVGGKTVAGLATVTDKQTALPAPFISKSELAAQQTSSSFLPGWATATALYKGNYLGAYEIANKEIAAYTTDISGIGRTLTNTKDITNAGPAGEVANFFKGVYVGASQHPVDIALTFGGGEAITMGENALRLGVAKAAMSELPVVSTAGRILSTPAAADVIGIGKTGLGAFIVAESGINIISQPTATTKGEALGRTSVQFAGFGAGMGNINSVEPENYYAGREFFSGNLGISALERAQFKAETTARSVFAAEPQAYREVATIALPGRTIEPVIKAEPNFNILTTSGKYAPEIRSTLMEQPHSVVGSSALIQQYTPQVAESAGLRIGKDVDALIESPTKALSSLSSKTGLTTEAANAVFDVHPVPANYPGIKPSIEADLNPPESSWFTRTFGDPYRGIAFPRGTSEIVTPGKGYIGDITYEAAQVQFGRKASAVSLVMQNPIQYGYRGEKDIYDYVSQYAAQRSVGLASGIPEKQFAASDKAMASFMEREFTLGTEKGQRVGENKPTITKSVRDIYNTLSEEAKTSRETARAGKGMAGNIEYQSIQRNPERGFLSNVGRSVYGSGGLLVSPAGSSYISRSLTSNVVSGVGSTYPSYGFSPVTSSIVPSQSPTTPSSTILSPSQPTGGSKVIQPGSFMSLSAMGSVQSLSSPNPSPLFISTSAQPSVLPKSFTPASPSGGMSSIIPPLTPSQRMPGFQGGAALTSGFGRKGYGRFREVLLGVNYNSFNVRSGKGATLPSLKGRKNQQINFGNVSKAITGTKPAKKGRKKK